MARLAQIVRLIDARYRLSHGGEQQKRDPDGDQDGPSSMVTLVIHGCNRCRRTLNPDRLQKKYNRQENKTLASPVAHKCITVIKWMTAADASSIRANRGDQRFATGYFFFFPAAFFPAFFLADLASAFTGFASFEALAFFDPAFLKIRS